MEMDHADQHRRSGGQSCETARPEAVARKAKSTIQSCPDECERQTRSCPGRKPQRFVVVGNRRRLGANSLSPVPHVGGCQPDQSDKHPVGQFAQSPAAHVRTSRSEERSPPAGSIGLARATSIPAAVSL